MSGANRKSSLSARDVRDVRSAVDHLAQFRANSPEDGAGALSASKDTGGVLDSQKRMSFLQLRGDTLLVWFTIAFVALTSGIGSTLIGLVLWKRMMSLLS